MAHSPYPHSDRELLARIGRSAGSKAGYKQLVRELGLGGGRQRRLLVEQLTKMVARGELRRMEEGLWGIPKPPAEASGGAGGLGAAGGSGGPGRIGSGDSRPRPGDGGRGQGFEAGSRGGRERLQSGRLELHRDGYGFVRLEPGKTGSATQAGAGAAAGDIFIPPPGLHGAMHGDLVLVDEEAPARDGRRSGRVARILTRRNPTLVGIFHYGRSAGRRAGRSLGSSFGRGSANQDGDGYEDQDRGLVAFGGNFVRPLDDRLGGPVEIAEGDEVVAAGLGSPHRTLGAAATRTRPDATRPGGAGHDAHSAEAEEALVVPDTDSVKPESLIADKADADGNPPWGPEGLEGLAVEVEITSFAQPGRPARGRVVEILGPPDGFGVDVEIVIRKHAIPHTFPAHVLAEAEERARESVATLAEEELGQREDFRGLPIVTIDGETARDFDDAVLVRPLPNGHIELQVHIADVGWYVRDGSALDTEARVRGTSVYFPDRAVPMLPHALSSGMCSLLPHEDRLVMSCVMEVDGEGEIVRYRVGEGMIRSVRRMTYTSVQRCLNASPAAVGWNGGERSAQGEAREGSQISSATAVAEALEGDPSLGDDHRRSKNNGEVRTPRRSAVTAEPSAEDRAERERIGLEQPELVEAFDRMLELALRLNRKRVRRGSIDFDLPEPVVEFDPEGNMKAIVRSERGWAHRLIEEFMLSANECVATWLTGQGIASIYRIHEMPDPKRVVEFEETAAGFGQTLGIGALPVKRITMKSDRREVQRRSAMGQRGGSAATHEIPERIPVTPQMYQRLVRRIQGTPEERILAYLMLRSLKQARYAEKNEGHFALASPCYTHFTSPIRRYPDLVVHRLLRTMLRRGVDGQGGAILSGDPQPWAAELARSRGKPAAAPAGGRAEARVVAPRAVAARVADAVPRGEAKPPRERRHAGRIGWSSGGEGSSGGDAPLSAASSAANGNGLAEVEEQRSFPTDVAIPTADRAGDGDAAPQRGGSRSGGPIAAEELSDIALESSQAERRAADAERELIEWKKMKFMADRIGEDFRGIILSVTKYGFFVELDEMFIEGLVPIGSLPGDAYSFRDTDRTICGAQTEHCFRAGDRVEVILDRIDRQQRRLQFALLPGTEPVGRAGGGSLRAGKSEAKKARAEARRAEKVAAKPKSVKKAKGVKKAKARKRPKG